MFSKQKLLEQKDYYPNGNIAQHVFIKNGGREGECKTWYMNGRQKMRAFYRNGKLDGEYKYWYENGYLEEHQFYRNEKLEGRYTRWRRDGSLYVRHYWKNNIIVYSYFHLPEANKGLMNIKNKLRKDILDDVNIFLIPDLKYMVESSI
jgi:antitoxin component YwqK of YwqJK toxin-antitoxin module